MRLPLSEPRVIYKDNLETDKRSKIGSEFNFEIDLPGKRYRSTIYRLNLIKLYRRKPELANLVIENSSEGIDFEILYSVKLIMDFGFQDPGTIVLRQKDINLVTGKPFRIKTCCSSEMLINSLREDKVSFRFRCKRDGAVKPYSSRCLVRKSEPIPVLAYQMHKIYNKFYGFTSWSRTRTTPIDCPWIFMINQLWSDQCTWPWVHCLLSELREWRQKTGRHNGLKEFGAPLTIGEAYLKIIMLSFLVLLYEGILEAGGVMDKCVQMWTKNYGALGQTARCVLACYAPIGRGRGKDWESGEEKEKEKKKEKELGKRQGLVVLGSGEENPRILLGDADQESKSK
ncbi:uncharacterized protein TNCV_4876641 [Trichonephila clavipes]|nr:uncharacterized protein TNCV_4876641 [Trichonephila clavipes]